MLHNPEFYKHLKAATKEASVLLHDIKSDRIIPKKGTINDVIARGSFFMSCVQFLMKDLSIERLITIQKPEERLEEIRNTLLRYIKKYLGDPHLDIIPPLPIWGTDKMSSYSIDGFFKEFNEQTFNDYYAEYEQFLYSNLPIKYHIVVALENFFCDLSSTVIRLSSNTRIIPNRSTFYFGSTCKNNAECMNDPSIKGGIFNPPFFWLEIDCEMEKEKVPSELKEHIEQVSLEEVQKVFKILRSYKEGDFRYSLVYWCPKTPCDPPYNYDVVFCYMGNYHNSNKYLLKEDDVKECQLLFRKYTDNSNKKDFPHSAIYYLDKGVRETDMNDRLVDYTAALESLFVDGKEGIAFQLAHKTAFFLEKDRQKCREIFKDIKKAYGFRCNIVHGDYHKIKDELELNKYTKITERYARRAIIKWIDMIDKGRKRQEIYDLIEENLFS